MKSFKEKFGKPSATEWTKGPQSNESLRPSTSEPHNSIQGWRGKIKRAVDVVGSSTACVLLLPVFVLTAAAVRLTDNGPVFYCQTRVGLGGRHFKILKFRTMNREAERDLGPIWAVPDDPRCTPIGYYLRRLGIDELPQLWNIFRGEMSFIGPRPERPQFTTSFEEEYPDYDVRHTVRPGLTGFAQVHGWRGYTSLEMRLRHDLYYIRNWSLGLDARVLLLTLIRGLSERTRDGVR